MQRKYEFFIKDILNNIQDIKEFINGYTYEDFIKDKKTQNAVTRSFEIIGEAISNLPNNIKEENSHIPWKDIKNYRNIIIHQYWKVDYEAEWNIIETKLDILEKHISEILNKS